MKRYFLYLKKLRLIGLLMVWVGIAEVADASNGVESGVEAAATREAERAIALLPNREYELVAEINWARTDPAAYADWLETLRPYYSGTTLSLPGETRIRTHEGVTALEDAIAVLRQQSPLAPLRLSLGMSHGGRDWVTYADTVDSAGDRLSRYGSWSGSALEVVSSSQQSAVATVAAWLIDDGNPNRTMRATLLSAELKFMGVACGDRQTGDRLCVLNYATDYTEQDGSTASLENTPTARQPSSEGSSIALVPPNEGDAVEPELDSELDSERVPAPPDPSKRAPGSSPVESSDNPAADFIANPDLPDPLPPSAGVPMPVLMAAIAQTDYVSTLAAEFLDVQELELIAEANRLRDNPSAYAAELETLMQYFDGNILRLPGLPPLETIEGAAAMEEAIIALRQLDRLPPLNPSSGLSLAARDHARDLGTTGMSGHIGRDRSTPFERINRYGSWDAEPGAIAGENISFSPWVSAYWHILQWVVDDGVSNRGHREALLRPRYKFTGTACHPHAYGNVCVMTYASDYTESH